jgi:hypothetical protein
MTLGQLQLEGFNYKVIDTEATYPDKTTKPVKLLAFQEKQQPGIVVTFVFQKAEFEEFLLNIQDKKIVEAKALPNVIPFKR